MTLKRERPTLLVFDDIVQDDEDNDYDDSTIHATIVCKYCGKSGLLWEQETNGKWILYDAYSGEIHKCRIKKQITPIDQLMTGKIK